MDSNDLIRAYSKDPINYFEMDDYTVKYTQENGICGDNVTVFLRIDENDMIEAYSFAGYPQMFTKAAASLLAENIEWTPVNELLTRDYGTMKAYWLDVSPRRKRSIVSALLAARNAIHQWKHDGEEDTYEDLLEV